MRPALAVLLLSAYTLTGTRNQITPVCQGEYSKIKPDANGRTHSFTQDRWRMYAMPDGNYGVEVQRLPLSEPFRVDERHIFTKAMEPLSADIAIQGGARIHCDYQLREIACLKFRLRDSGASDSEESTYLWMSKSGLLLRVTSGSTVTTRLSAYQGPRL